MGPSLEYGCFITISLVHVGPFFHYTTLSFQRCFGTQRTDLNGFWVLLIHRRHISHTKVAPKGQANSTKQRGSLKSQASLKYHGGDLLMEWFWLVCTDGPWSSVMGSGCWKTLIRCDKRCAQIGILWFCLLLSRVKEEERCFQSRQKRPLWMDKERCVHTSKLDASTGKLILKISVTFLCIRFKKAQTVPWWRVTVSLFQFSNHLDYHFR